MIVPSKRDLVEALLKVAMAPKDELLAASQTLEDSLPDGELDAKTRTGYLLGIVAMDIALNKGEGNT